ncbi:MAG: twin-arginine translocase TatA/TatE family subunit [Chloroflexi bacterium]|nr:twin-arginine translocase TatA/TatE family subunit [Chloroflexota bacterium]MBM4466961.1 twin-arginine translocase TatA/TatE family subunit [Chloroflexota bacterium]
MVPHLGPMELVIILVLVMIIFGVGKLPEIGGAIGKGLREFRQAQSEVEELTKPVEADKPGQKSAK